MNRTYSKDDVRVLGVSQYWVDFFAKVHEGRNETQQQFEERMRSQRSWFGNIWYDINQGSS